METRFNDRRHAGRVLAVKLQAYAGRSDGIVLALPRGGVPVAVEVARLLRLPLDLCIVRKLGVPGHEELAMGAIAGNGIRVLDHPLIRELGIAGEQVEEVIAREQRELQRRQARYRGAQPAPALRHRTVILVDDGLATGSTMLAAVQFARADGAARVVAAVPVGAPEACRALGRVADACICAVEPSPFGGVGRWYDDFSQTTDAEVLAALIGAAPLAGSAT